MSKPVKTLMIRDYGQRLEGHGDALLISVRGIDAITTNRLRQELAKKDIKITVIRNALARQVVRESGLSALEPLLKGPSALAYGAESVIDVARELMKWGKEIEKLEMKGAVLDGQLFAGHAGVEALSKYPTREEALAKLVGSVLGPARKLASCAKAPASNIAGAVKSMQDKLEKGEAIAKVA
ncbi:MAG: 50S ribosomal protein L10 [Phycisphaerales bacterium]|nr:50S ribosomal protein L10 [Phycisphaerales bacterium]